MSDKKYQTPVLTETEWLTLIFALRFSRDTLLRKNGGRSMLSVLIEELRKKLEEGHEQPTPEG